MSKIILYHGSTNKEISPEVGKGNNRHDYGNGFYLTEDIELAKEWAVCKPTVKNGYVHTFSLDIDDLKILDFQKHDVLCWLAELMKHRDADDSRRYKLLSIDFIKQYSIDSDSYDVIKGYRANASFFFIAKEFVKDNIDVDILDQLLSKCELGIQYCIKSEKAFNNLVELKEKLVLVDYNEFNIKYNTRDVKARNNMKELVDSDKN